MDILRQLYECFRPALQGLFSPSIPFNLRWRMVGLGLLNTLAVPMKCIPWMFSRSHTVHMIPNRNGQNIRCLVFQPAPSPSGKLRPLHLTIHSGAFIGGINEMSADWATEVCNRTGAVVVCSTYRFAPKWVYPAAHDDTDDVVDYLMKNAEMLWGADPKLFTVSGQSAGGNLAMAISQQEKLRYTEDTGVKGAVMMWSPIDLRLPPQDKPRPLGFPTNDPLSWLVPLFDSYPGPVRSTNMENPRMNPCIAPADVLPEHMLFVIPTMDILSHEELTAAQRIKEELEGSNRKVETLICEGEIHGFAELPDLAVPKERKFKVWDAGVEFLKEVHAQYGFIFTATD